MTRLFYHSYCSTLRESFLRNVVHPATVGEFAYALLVATTIIAVIYVTLLLRKKDASYFSCVVFLSIVVIHIRDG